MPDRKIDILPYSFDDGILEKISGSESFVIKIYRPEGVAVVLGRGSDPSKELNLENCIADDVIVMRRRGGGCAVVLDPGDLIVSLALKANGIGRNDAYFRNISDYLMSVLERLGITGLYQDGISDLVRDSKKVAGSCIYRNGKVLLYSAVIMVNPDLSLVSRYLKHPPREPKYRRSRSHEDFLLPVSAFSDFKTAAELEPRLEEKLNVEGESLKTFNALSF